MIPLTPSLLTDVASSALAGVGCLAVVIWILRTPDRSFLEQRSAPILAALSALYLLRSVGWLYEWDSLARWIAFWPGTILPLVMALFVEGLLRRHLPLWMKGLALILTAYFVGAHIVPLPLREDLLFFPWPIGVVLFIALLAHQLWTHRDAGLSHDERSMIAGVVVVAIVGIPLAFSDARGMTPMLHNRPGAMAGLLLARVLLAPPGRSGLVDAAFGMVRVLARGVVVAAVLVLTGVATDTALVLTLAITALLLFDVIDRLRRRRGSEIELQLITWLAQAPRDSLASWIKALREAPLMSDALVLDESELRGHDADGLRTLFAREGDLLTESLLQRVTERQTRDDLLAVEAALDLMRSYDLTHLGLLTSSPFRVVGVNTPEVAGREVALRLEAILRTGQQALVREGAAGA